ncbi:divergent polysaccharide deacetylase family protein [Campylobacter fetus]|uniref:divergent polysaccharide deacetylase family protein n=1 Tax=Campylobacter fetus TaxID=196 RepID=UPI003AF8AB10
MAKRSRKKAPKTKKGAFLVYIGIAVCLLAIFGVIYAVSGSKKDPNLDSQKTIKKIERYLDTQKNEISKDKNISFNRPNLKKDKNISELFETLKFKVDSNISDSDKNITVALPKEQIVSPLKPNLKKEISMFVDQNITSKLDENSSNSSLKYEQKNIEKIVKKQYIHKFEKPKLVIIIDDLSTMAQARDIKSLGLKITPSIFPPTDFYPDSVKISKQFEFYMVHLPLEAIFFKKNEQNTLNVGDTKDKIENRISTIKKQFGNVSYINNHTGSKFTSDYSSMKMLLKSMKNHNILFVDSLTSKGSKAKQVTKEMGLKYVFRDVFIDNDQSSVAIFKQLEIAIKKAKKNGFAIAIGHPYKVTFETIKVAKKTILKDVEVVYLKDIYGLYN